MNKIIPIAFALMLAGCATSQPLPPSGPGLLSPLVDAGVVSEATRTKARQVQATTKGLCQYVPTLASLISLVSSGIGGSAGAIGAAVCNAVTTAPLADGGGRLAYVNGVRIHGKFVR